MRRGRGGTKESSLLLLLLLHLSIHKQAPYPSLPCPPPLPSLPLPLIPISFLPGAGSYETVLSDSKIICFRGVRAVCVCVCVCASTVHTHTHTHTCVSKPIYGQLRG